MDEPKDIMESEINQQRKDKFCIIRLGSAAYNCRIRGDPGRLGPQHCPALSGFPLFGQSLWEIERLSLGLSFLCPRITKGCP